MNAPAHLTARIEAAHAILAEAGTRALAYFAEVESLAVEAKANGQDVVSIADRAVEQLVRGRLAQAFPEDGFLGEESGTAPARSDFVWVLDPIDGTSCFVHGIANWCVALALVERGRTVAGFILDPNAQETFIAVHGAGATLNGRPIRVDTRTDLRHGLTSVGASFRVPAQLIAAVIRRLLEAGGMFVRGGSGALSLAHVACGRLAAYYEPHMHAWDCLAGLLLIREAGGWTHDFAASGDLAAGGPVIGCAPQLCEDLLGLIEAARMEALA
ncbi:myo-inositol-1(or 4)-monophosphatase [Angulomicrobium amanitiforme]|uniref:Myo-inositol-1(Or 4)-monophosphatase n=1 Tax=Ancylobacter amanitiformis TaxID=217069 RepID=A0ABU0LME4_9HYPH|nr:inositol monophosphatase [Ancylobacter amanitiformis]MDQ0509871.1 myo-inositol-1(or 4)-monophosphatase [Ancylobacter amanitiformis]